ncbi:MAG: dihydroneopterin aldolase [Holosporaceae bacterium]|jgi:dihydroneopterin aldolase|nr:dihydroneopterin aldolase [Holosporaceae bacterium]
MLRQLDIERCGILICLGLDEIEKVTKRMVFIDISLRFPHGNRACQDDQITQTVCYRSLLCHMKEKLTNIEFNLIERVAQFLYDEISGYLDDKSILKRIKITKPTPMGNDRKCRETTFTCSDW